MTAPMTSSDSETPVAEVRKFAPGRYFKRTGFNLDHDGSKYVNSYSIFDGDKDTGISVCDAGDSAVPNSNRRTIVFQGKNYSLMRDAIFAYEDQANV
jgi:hypothetical protein